MKKRVTMQTIADALGVGKVTVSRAFKGDPKCGAALRAKILAKAEALGYAPDPLQRVHMAQLRAGTAAEQGAVIVMLDVHDRGRGLEENVSNARFVRGARDRAESIGLKLEVFRPFADGIPLQRLMGIFRARGIHGLIMGPVPEERSELDLKLDGVAAVAIAHSLRAPALHRVGHNHYAALRSVMERMYAQGTRRFGLALQPDMDARVGQRWHAAFSEFRRTHTSCRFSFYEPELSVAEKMPDEATRRAMEAWLDAEEPGVVFGISAWLPAALAVLRPEGGCRYVDLDWYPGKFPMPVAGIDQNFEGIGAAAVDEIMALWGRQEYGVPEASKTILLQGGWRGGFIDNRSA